jgi:soluble lytic murein transglycosylase-like protein
MSTHLKHKIPDAAARREFLDAVRYEGIRAGLAPELMLAIIDVDSAFHKYKASERGERGYMQVPLHWVNDIGDGDPRKLFHLQTNLRYGCVILRYYIDQAQGDFYVALARWGAEKAQKSPSYQEKILKSWKDYQQQVAER